VRLASAAVLAAALAASAARGQAAGTAELCAPLDEQSTARVLPLAQGAPPDPQPALRLPDDARPTSQALSLTIDPAQPRFSGVAAIALQLDRPRSTLWLHGRGLHVTEAHVDLQGARLPVTYEQVTDNGLVRVTLPCQVSGRALLSIAWDAPFNEQLSGLYVAREKGVPYAFTQFEAIDARRAFPSFDEPAFKIPWDLELTVPAKDVAVANSAVADERPADHGMRSVRFNTTPALPTYLLAFAVGPFDVVSMPPLPPNELRARPLPVRGIAPQGRGPELRFALEVSAALLPRLEAWFGIGYPYEKLDHIAVPDFTYGAMENAGAITYRESALLFQPGVAGPQAEAVIATIMAHEMAHQWFGDLVTLRWWTDAWLNESFATWMEAKIVEEWRPELRAALGQLASVQAAMRSDATATARAVRRPVEDEDSIWNQFDGLTYDKGAGLLSMVESWIGPDDFRAGIHAYLQSHANSGGSSDDLFAALGAASKRDVAGPLRTFLEQPGVPRVKARVTCQNKKVRVLLEQSRALPAGAAVSEAARGERWQIPLCVRASVLGELVNVCTLLRDEKGELEIQRTHCPEWVMPNAGGLGYYQFALGPFDLEALLKNHARLSAAERISLAANLESAYEQSAMGAADAARALEPLARDREPGASHALMALLEDAHQRAADPALRPALEAYARRAYAPLAQKLGWAEQKGEDAATRAQRKEVLEFLAQTARDPAVRAEGKQLGLAYARPDGDSFDSSAVAPDLSEIALSIAVQESGPELRKKLLARLAASDVAAIRRRIVGALGSLRDPAATPGLLQLSLDGSLHKNERLTLPLSQLAHVETRAAALTWLSAHWDALVAAIPADSGSTLVRAVAESSCDKASLAAAESFLAPRAGKISAAALELQQGLESARLCVARRDAQAKSFSALLGKAPAHR